VSSHTKYSEQLDEDLCCGCNVGINLHLIFRVIKYQHKIIQLVNRYVKDPSEAQDVAQESFYQGLPGIG